MKRLADAVARLTGKVATLGSDLTELCDEVGNIRESLTATSGSYGDDFEDE